MLSLVRYKKYAPSKPPNIMEDQEEQNIIKNNRSIIIQINRRYMDSKFVMILTNTALSKK